MKITLVLYPNIAEPCAIIGANTNKPAGFGAQPTGFGQTGNAPNALGQPQTNAFGQPQAGAGAFGANPAGAANTGFGTGAFGQQPAAQQGTNGKSTNKQLV